MATNIPASSIAKLQAPALPHILRRTRLIELLNKGNNFKVSWIHAPPGYGKTTLVADFFQQSDEQLKFWYQVHEEDNSPSHFFRYFRLLFSDYLDDKNFPNVDANQWDIKAYAREFFTFIFSNIPDNFLLTLDDYHILDPQGEIHQIIKIMTECIPLHSKLIVASRSAPPAIFSTLSVNQTLRIVTSDELRFRENEVKDFLKLRGVNCKYTSQLQNQANGWIAGLILYLGNSRESPLENSPEYIESSQANIFNYFNCEIISRYTEDEVRIFSISSIYSYFSAEDIAELCHLDVEYVDRFFASLYLQNYFIEKRDQQYRFHPLFREFNQNLLETWSEEERFSLYRRAANLIWENGNIDEVVRLLINSRSWEKLEKICIENCHTLISEGRNQDLLNWIENIPISRKQASADLRYCMGLALIPFNHLKARQLLGDALEHYIENQLNEKSFTALSALIDTYFTLSDDFSSASIWIEKAKLILECSNELSNIDIEITLLTKLIRILYWCPEKLHLFPDLIDNAEKMFLRTSNLSVQINLASALLKLVVVNCQYYRLLNVLDVFQESVQPELLSPVDLIHFRYARVIVLYIRGEKPKEEMQLLGEAIVNLRRLGMSYMDIPSQDNFVYEACILGRADQAEQMIAEFHSKDSPMCMTNQYYLYLMKSWVRYIRKSYDEARSCLNLSMKEMHKTHGAYIFLPLYFKTLVEIDSRQYQEAEQCIIELEKIYQSTGLNLVRLMSLKCKSYYFIKQNKEDLALPFIKEMFAFQRDNLVYETVFRINHVVSAICATAIRHNIEQDFVKKVILFQLTPEPEDIEPVLHWPRALEISLLGKTEIKFNGKAVKFSGKPPRKAILLLKYLISKKGKPVSIEAICDAIWDDSSAMDTFKVTISRLRKFIGRSTVKVKDGKVSLNPSLVWVDTWSLVNTCRYLNEHIHTIEKTKLDEKYRDIRSMYSGKVDIPNERDYLFIAFKNEVQEHLLDFLIKYSDKQLEYENVEKSLSIIGFALEINAVFEPAIYRKILYLNEKGCCCEAIKAFNNFQYLLQKDYSAVPSLKIRKLIDEIKSHNENNKV